MQLQTVLSPRAPRAHSAGIDAAGRPLRIVIVGPAGHGKSSLIGRLLHDTGSLPAGKLDAVKAGCASHGVPFRWSYVLYALQSERDGSIAADANQVRLRTHARDIVLIDAPGDADLLRGVIAGDAPPDAAILVVEALKGVCDETRRHAYLLHLLGIRQIVVVVSKMDRIAYDATRFREIESEIGDYLRELELEAAEVIPVSTREGDGTAEHTYTLEWFRPTLVEALDALSPV